MRVFAIVASAVVVTTSLFIGSAPESRAENDDKPTSFWMQKKMEYTQDILRGLASADYEKIGASARQMRLLNKVEGFVRRRNEDYRTQLHTFERVCDDMIQQADKENLPGITLAFNQMTVSCVSCHQSLRAPEVDVSVEPTRKAAKSRKSGD